MISKQHLQVSLEQVSLVPGFDCSKPAITSEMFELLRPVLLLQWLHEEVCQKGDIESVKFKIKTSLGNDDQPAGLTSILSLTETPGFALLANSTAFSRAARERTVPDSVISFLSASACTLTSASFSCASFSSFARTAFSKSESLIDLFRAGDGLGARSATGCRDLKS